jgi:WD40 repeat protein
VIHELAGHQDTPIALDISPDGRQALSAGLDGQAILWDLKTGQEIRRFSSPGTSFMGGLLHPDGQRALTSASDGSLGLWDLASGEMLRRFEGHSGWAMDIVLSPDGEIVYSTSYDGTILAWDVDSGELISTYQPFTASFANCLAISPDGIRLLGGEGQLVGPNVTKKINYPLVLVDANTGEKLLNLDGHTAPVESVAFSPDGRYALSGSRDLSVRLWDTETGTLLAGFIGHTDTVWKVAFSPDGLTGYSTSLDGSLRVWDLSEYISRSESPLS